MDGSEIAPEDLDFTSNLILTTLLNAGGRATAGYLKEQTGVDQTQQIHYRCDPDTDGPSKLALLEFIELTGETEKWNGHPSKVYRLTDAGEEYALNHNLELAPEMHRSQLEDAVGQLRDHVTAVNQNAKTANKNAQHARNEVKELSEKVTGWENEASRRDEKLNHLETRVNNLNRVLSEQEVTDAIEQLDELEGRVEKLEREVGIEEAAEVDDLQGRVDALERDVGTMWSTLGMSKMIDWGQEWTLTGWIQAIEDVLPHDDERKDSSGEGRLSLFGD